MSFQFIDPTTNINEKSHPLLMLSAMYSVSAGCMSHMITKEQFVEMMIKVINAAQKANVFTVVWDAYKNDSLEIEGWPATRNVI